MSKRLEFWDTTLRDAHQCLWATRMTSEMMRPALASMDRAGYWNIGIAGTAVFDACIHYLGEDPWQRLAMVNELAPSTRKSCYIRSLNVLGWDIFPDDVFELTIATLARYGINVINAFDALNDTRNMEPTIRFARDAGAYCVGSIVYSISPVHDDEHFVRKARELVSLGVHGVQLKDSGALLTQDRVRSLVPALKAAIGADIDLHFHTHCTTGLGPMTTLEALPLGVDVVHTAVSPLANGASQPATEMIAREASLMGFDVPLDLALVDEQASHFLAVAQAHEKPLGQPVAYDPAVYRHQVPGGMISNLKTQMADLGQADQFHAVLEEVVQVRKELGFPIMVSPMSQFIAVQALFNIVHGQRYKIVPDEIKNYALGWYGAPVAPLDEAILDRITGGAEPISARPGSLLPPRVEQYRQQLGSSVTDEELVLALHYKPKLLDAWRNTLKHNHRAVRLESPITTLVKALSERPEVTYFSVRKGELSFDYSSSSTDDAST